jgi:hypothetical protein
MSDMNEARYNFGACTWSNDFIYVFGGMNDSFMEITVKENFSKCLNTIEKYVVSCNRWDRIQLTTSEKLPFMSHLLAIHLP